MRRVAISFLLVSTVLWVSGSSFGAEKKKMSVSVYVSAAQPKTSPEGFVDGSNAWLVDSVADLKKSLSGKEFTPNKTCPGSRTQFVLVNNPDDADIALTVAARGTNSAAMGQRTTMEVYNGVVLANTVPTYGITRWVSLVLSVGQYSKEFMAWSTNHSVFSAGAWRQDTGLLAKMSACWVMNNEAQIFQRQMSRKKP